MSEDLILVTSTGVEVSISSNPSSFNAFSIWAIKISGTLVSSLIVFCHGAILDVVGLICSTICFNAFYHGL